MSDVHWPPSCVSQYGNHSRTCEEDGCGSQARYRTQDRQAIERGEERFLGQTTEWWCVDHVADKIGVARSAMDVHWVGQPRARR